MLGFRQDFGPSFGFQNAHSNAHVPILNDMQQKLSSGEVETARAVEPTADSATISAQAQTKAELDALMERLSNATLAADVKSALLAVKDFVNNNSHAEMIGSAIGGLAEMADSVLAAMEADPASAPSGFSFAFSGSFATQTISSEDFYSNKTSLNFSFSFSNGDTRLRASMSYGEALTIDGNGLKYQSYEKVKLNMVTMNANLDENPALQAFIDLTTQLSGIDLSGMFESQESQPEQAKLSYRSVSVMERYEMQYAQVDSALQNTKSMIDWLEEWQAKQDEQKAEPVVNQPVAMAS